MLKLFALFELRKVLKYFKTKTGAKIITTSLFLVIFTLIGVGIYFFFASGLRYINIDVVDDLKNPLLLFLYELFLLILALVIVFSALVSGIFNLFKSEETSWLISSPSFAVFPKLVYIRSILSSTWPLLVMFLPAILAFNKVYTLGITGFFMMLALVFLLLLTLNALTLLFILLVSKLYYSLSNVSKLLTFSFKGVVVLLMATVTGIAVYLWKLIAYVDVVRLFRAEETEVVIDLAVIGSHFNFLPTHPFAMFMIYWQNGSTLQALTYFGILAVLALLTIALWWKYSSSFYPLWQKLQEGTPSSQKEGTTLSSPKITYHFTGTQTIALFKKELLVAMRNYRGILWFAFLFAIWFAQIAANVALNKNVILYQTDLSPKMIALQVLQFTVAIYFICSFTLRFVFPSFSVEKKTAWILGSAPLSFRKIFFGKYLFFVSFFLLLGGIMGYVGATALQISVTYALYLIALFIAVVMFIVTLGLTLGALFPSTESDDPESISTSMPGLSFTALSLLYGGLSAWLLYLALTKSYFVILGGFIGLTFAGVGALLYYMSHVTKRELL